MVGAAGYLSTVAFGGENDGGAVRRFCTLCPEHLVDDLLEVVLFISRSKCVKWMGEHEDAMCGDRCPSVGLSLHIKRQHTHVLSLTKHTHTLTIHTPAHNHSPKTLAEVPLAGFFAFLIEAIAKPQLLRSPHLRSVSHLQPEELQPACFLRESAHSLTHRQEPCPPAHLHTSKHPLPSRTT